MDVVQSLVLDSLDDLLGRLDLLIYIVIIQVKDPIEAVTATELHQDGDLVQQLGKLFAVQSLVVGVWFAFRGRRFDELVVDVRREYRLVDGILDEVNDLQYLGVPAILLTCEECCVVHSLSTFVLGFRESMSNSATRVMYSLAFLSNGILFFTSVANTFIPADSILWQSVNPVPAPSISSTRGNFA
jgi:hypothetical protein